MNNVKQKIFEKTVIATRVLIEDFDPAENTQWTCESITAAIADLEDLIAASDTMLNYLLTIQDEFDDESIEEVTFTE